VRTLLVAPHADDETLFASYLAQRYAAHVLVVYDEGRENELAQATQWLGCTYTQLGVEKGATIPEVRGALDAFATGWWDGDRVIAPAIEDYGHDEHNIVAHLAEPVFGSVYIRYRTYAPRGTRSHGNPSEPFYPDYIARKLAALACYRSQIEEPSTRPWFYELLDMREWTA